MNHHQENKKKNKKSSKKRVITTDLFELIGAVADEVEKEEAYLIPEAVLGILNHNKVTFIKKQNRQTNN